MRGKKPGKTASGDRRRVEDQRKPAPNSKLAAQTRKILGKHYASKYRTGKR